MLKIKGPSIDPCGTPLSSSVHSLLVFPSLIRCLWSVCVSLDPRINLCKLAIATEMYSDIRVYRDGDGGGRWVGWRWGMWVMCHRVQTYVWMKWYSKNKSHTFFRIYNIFHIHEDCLHYITDMLFENIQRHYNNIDNTYVMRERYLSKICHMGTSLKTGICHETNFLVSEDKAGIRTTLSFRAISRIQLIGQYPGCWTMSWRARSVILTVPNCMSNQWLVILYNAKLHSFLDNTSAFER